MIYKSQYNALLPEPEVKEPIKKDFYVGSQWSYIQFKKEYYDSHVQAYNNWLSSQILTPYVHCFEDGKSYHEGTHFNIQKEIKVNFNGVDEWTKASDYLYEYYPIKHRRIVAIPIKDYEPEANNSGLASVASHSSTFGNSIEQEKYIKHNGERYIRESYVLNEFVPKYLLMLLKGGRIIIPEGNKEYFTKFDSADFNLFNDYIPELLTKEHQSK